MKSRLLLGILLFSHSFVLSGLPVSSIITFFIHLSPFTAPEEVTKFSQKMAIPGKIATKIANSLTSQPSRGIFATYGGYLSCFNSQWQITFPRMQQKADFFLIVTENIKPIFMIGTTIHHWEFSKMAAADLFSSKKTEPGNTIILLGCSTSNTT